MNQDNPLKQTPPYGPALGRVYERDVDLLLLEEALLDDGFSDFLIQQLALPIGFQITTAWHSISTYDGESDLIILGSTGATRTALFIENKVDASQQPLQPERYRTRARADQARGHFEEFITIIAAPQSYIDQIPAQSYDHPLPYEAIRDWFHGKSNPRCQYRANLLTAAIQKSLRGYSVEEVPHMTQRHREYADRVARTPLLTMTPVTPKGARSTWIVLYPVPARPGVSINHKADRSSMDLSFAQTPSDALAASVARLPTGALPKGAIVLQTGGSASLRLPVPELDWLRPLPDQTAFAAALQAAETLARCAKTLDL